jgi:hypothetical protein
MRRWPFLLGWRQQAKRMMGLFPRLFSAVLWAAVLSCSGSPVLAQSGELKPPEQQKSDTAPGEGAKNGQKTDELAEAAAALNGPAGSAECVWLGRRVVSLLWRDDLDTAFRHLDLYDRFGCPASHVQAAFRCLVRMGPFESKAADSKPADGKPPESKAPDNLNSRVHACWINPGPANPQEAPATTTANPARR